MVEDTRTTVVRVSIDDIKPDPAQPRKVFTDKHIDELAVNIQTVGLINPLECDKNMMIITGECRWRAAKKAGWTEIPVIINETPLTSYERLRRQLSENMLQSSADKSEQMNPTDTAKGLARLAILKAYSAVRPANSKEKTYLSKALNFPNEARLYQAISAYSNKELIEVYQSIPVDVKNGLIQAIVGETGIKRTTIWELLQLLDQPAFVIEDVQRGRPRTFYREAGRAPKEAQKIIQEKIAKGEYVSREQVKQDVAIAKQVPDLAKVALDRQQAKESTKTNQILNSIVRLGLALEAQQLSAIEEREREIVKKQLLWIQEKITSYLSEGGNHDNEA